jgi:large subunit ribosomal protein L6
MSRIGKRPIPVPAGVEIEIDQTRVRVKGPKGELERELHREIVVRREGEELLVERPSDQPQHRSLHGLTRTLVANMIEGVTTGYKKTLEIVGVGYRAENRPFGLNLNLGYSHPIEYRAPEGITLKAASPTVVEVTGINKEVVGQVAAEIRSLRPPKP